jgi:histidine triad (HIT) family protein
MRSCAFCRIARGEESARIAYQDEDVTAFFDRNPQAPTHVLIIPNKHIESVNQVEPADTDLLGRLFVVARRVAEQEDVLSGYRLVVNTGSQAGQSVFHLHMHLLGGRRLSWPPG